MSDFARSREHDFVGLLRRSAATVSSAVPPPPGVPVVRFATAHANAGPDPSVPPAAVLPQSYPVFWEGPGAHVAAAAHALAEEAAAADTGPSLWTLAPVAAFLVLGSAFVLWALQYLDRLERELDDL
jgi:hypothetical protein